MDDIEENVGLTNEIKPFSMLIDVLKEITNYLEGRCTVNEINEIRAYLNHKIAEAKKRAADNLNLSSIEETGEFISVTLPSSKKKKLTAQNIINVLNNNLDINHHVSIG